MASSDDSGEAGSSETVSTDAGSSATTPSDPTSSASSDAGSSDAGSSDSTSSDSGSSDAGSSDATSSDAGAGTASSDGGTSSSSDCGSIAGSPTASSSSSSAAVDYKAIVPIPSDINDGLTSVDPATMLTALGNPGTPDPACGASSAALQKIMKTANVGPFRVTGLGPAVDALTRVFAAVQTAKPDLYNLLGTDGMLCVRYVRGSTTNLSNHAWGTAIDIKIGGVLTQRGSTTVTQGLVDLCPFMHAERFFWGAGFSPTPDGMHYEASSELIADWKANGSIP